MYQQVYVNGKWSINFCIPQNALYITKGTEGDTTRLNIIDNAITWPTSNNPYFLAPKFPTHIKVAVNKFLAELQ